jgi:hypothetical protein
LHGQAPSHSKIAISSQVPNVPNSKRQNGVHKQIGKKKNSLHLELLQTYAWISQGVADVRQYQANDVQKRANENHGSHNGEVLARNSLYQITTQTGDSKKRFRDQASHE